MSDAPFDPDDGQPFCTTDGPWHLHDMETATVCGSDHLAIADCNARSRVEGENIANARLVSAAPDLLSLAQSLPVMLALAAKLHPDSPINWGQFEKDANEAIAKAGG